MKVLLEEGGYLTGLHLDNLFHGFLFASILFVAAQPL
jgi:hypothetical protein